MSNWFKKALEIKLNNPDVTYREIGDKLGVTQNAVKKAFSRAKKKAKETDQEPEQTTTSQILKEIHREKTVSELCDLFKISPKVLEAHLIDLEDAGYMIHYTGETVKLSKSVLPSTDTQNCEWKGEKIIRFGAVSDAHLGSICQQLTHLSKMYDTFSHEGIETVYNVGDLSDGFKMRPGHEFELFIHGADAQEDYIIENYPQRPDMKTLFILGNHDASHIKNGGRDIGRGIALRRPDMKYLGMYNAKIPLTPNCILELNHPWDGAAYAISYSIQKYMDSMMGGDKPNILLNGHHHKAMYMFYRNIHAFETGCFQAQTSFERGKRIAIHLGGWIIEVHVHDDGTIWKCQSTFFPIYDAIKDDYRR